MTSIRRSGGLLSGARQFANNTGYISVSGGNPIQGLAARAHSATNTRRNVAFSFGTVDIPTGTLIRSAELKLYMDYTATDGAKYTVYGHKVAAPPALRSTTSEVSVANDVNTRLSAKTTASVSIDRSAPYTSTDRMVALDVTAIVQEVVNQVGWTSGNNMVFVLQSASDVDRRQQVQGAGYLDRPDIWPEFYVNFGNVSSDSFDVDLHVGFDSHGYCAGHAGKEINNVPIVGIPNWTNQVIDQTALGMADASALTGGNVYGAGDQKRGYSPGGILQDYLEEKYEDRIQCYRHEWSQGGTQLGQWHYQLVLGATEDDPWYDPEVSTGVNTWWTPITASLASPASTGNRALFWMSAKGNDILQYGKSTDPGVKIVPRGSLWDTIRENLTVMQVDIMTHVLQTWEDNDVDGRIIQPGYQTFQVMRADPGFMKYPPSDSTQYLERSVFGTDGYGFYGQTYWDGIRSSVLSTTIADPTNPFDPGILAQSTYIKWAMWRQIDVYGAFNGSLTLQWNECLAWAATVPNGLTWTRSFGAPVNISNMDGWEDAFRNIDDITVNTMLIGETEAINIESRNRVIEDHPEWEDKIFVIHKAQANGVDTLYSADPDSPYAQAPVVMKTDGIHPQKAYFENWVSQIVDELDTLVDFLPGYISPPAQTNFMCLF